MFNKSILSNKATHVADKYNSPLMAPIHGNSKIFKIPLCKQFIDDRNTSSHIKNEMIYR